MQINSTFAAQEPPELTWLQPEAGAWMAAGDPLRVLASDQLSSVKEVSVRIGDGCPVQTLTA